MSWTNKTPTCCSKVALADLFRHYPNSNPNTIHLKKVWPIEGEIDTQNRQVATNLMLILSRDSIFEYHKGQVGSSRIRAPTVKSLKDSTNIQLRSLDPAQTTKKHMENGVQRPASSINT